MSRFCTLFMKKVGSRDDDLEMCSYQMPQHPRKRIMWQIFSCQPISICFVCDVCACLILHAAFNLPPEYFINVDLSLQEMWPTVFRIFCSWPVVPSLMRCCPITTKRMGAYLSVMGQWLTYHHSDTSIVKEGYSRHTFMCWPSQQMPQIWPSIHMEVCSMFIGIWHDCRDVSEGLLMASWFWNWKLLSCEQIQIVVHKLVDLSLKLQYFIPRLLIDAHFFFFFHWNILSFHIF